MDYRQEYQRWLDNAAELRTELLQLSDEEIEDSFYKDLTFGTGGLRGVMGAGTNRMNIYTVAKASQGLVNHINKNYKNGSIAISYDSRRMSEYFAQIAAGVFVKNGIHVYMFPELMPTPCLSYATRYYHCSAGIMITASHNPADYNGYKVYNEEGCQITTASASAIQNEIDRVDIFRDVKSMQFQEAVDGGFADYISDDCYSSYIEDVKKQSVLFGDDIDRSFSIVYSPLNGTGLKPVTRVLKENGFSNVSLVEEQKLPDENFTTCPCPNPEIRETMEYGINRAREKQADLFMATDPDCDRIGIAVKDGEDYRQLTGNEVGILLLDYICSQRCRHSHMPQHPLMIKTIATSEMADKIACRYGVDTINVLTGFKYIGEQIGSLEKKGESNRYIFGFEESCGYLSGCHVRDKDAVNGAYLICEMYAYYKTRGVSLIQKLDELYSEYGYCLTSLHTYEYEGSAGMITMTEIMRSLRSGITCIGGKTVNRLIDYSLGIDGLPKSNALKFFLEDNCSILVRPSGTEPKLKIYISVCSPLEEDAEATEKSIVGDINTIIKK